MYSLQQIPDRPNCTYKSGPIVWLSSLDWCNFIQRRVREFYNFQERLSRFVDTPKYGSVMWILTHIIHEVYEHFSRSQIKSKTARPDTASIGGWHHLETAGNLCEPIEPQSHGQGLCMGSHLVYILCCSSPVFVRICDTWLH